MGLKRSILSYITEQGKIIFNSDANLNKYFFYNLNKYFSFFVTKFKKTLHFKDNCAQTQKIVENGRISKSRDLQVETFIFF